MHSPSGQVSFKPSPLHLHHASCRPCPNESICRSLLSKGECRSNLVLHITVMTGYGDGGQASLTGICGQAPIHKGRIEYEIRYQHDHVACFRVYIFDLLHFQATLLPLLGLEPPLDLFLSLVVSELLLELSAPPSVSPRCLLTSGFAGLTSSGLFLSWGEDVLAPLFVET